MTLLQAKKNRPVRIIEIPDERARAQCVRFGIGEGTLVDSAETLMAGPVLVRHRNQEICLGRNLACRILVEEDPRGSQGRDPVQGSAHGARFARRRGWRLRRHGV
ncbi:MAG: FeoA family protein [Thermoleophilia bacterium]